MKRGLKWIGIGVGGVVVLLALIVGGSLGFTRSHLSRAYTVDPAPLARPAGVDSADLVTRGRRLLATRGCADCHRPDFGGGIVAEDPMVGTLAAPNLTRGVGSAVAAYDEEADWVRSIRHGIGTDGQPLVFMPAHEFYPIGDGDLAAMIAALEAAPPVDRTIPETRVGPLAAILYVTGKMPLVPAELIDHEGPRPTAPEPGPTAEYGAYLATGCIGCHGEHLSGGKIPGGPPGIPVPANLTPDMETGLGAWTQADFVRLLRTGVRPDGRVVDPFMPVEMTKQFTDMELEAIWKYLRTVEPKPFGNR